MKYRRFGETDRMVSALGFGCMRFPTIGGDRSQIDEPRATEMLRYAIDHGVNYLDTGHNYHGGNSQRFLGRALQDGYREKVFLATKLRSQDVQSPSDFDRVLDEQLARLQTDHLDGYLLHGLREARWEYLYEMGVLPWAEKAKAEGRFSYFGFSFHDTVDVFKRIIDASEAWDFCQIQYNYMNQTYQAGTEGMRYAVSKGLAVVVMEPLLGGRLASPPESVQAVWDEASVQYSPAEWALRWVWNQPEVSLALSGMSTLEQVVENLASADRSGVGILTADELATIDRARAQYEALCAAPCTGCRYCMPCPNGVDIPGVFSLINNGVMYDTMEDSRRRYGRMPEEARADACIQCRQCEDECPQNIAIGDWMPLIHRVLGEGEAYDPEVCATL